MAENRCKVCTHSERERIDADIAGGMSNLAVAGAWGLSKDSVRRHRGSHLSAALKAVSERREAAGAETATSRAETLYVKASAILAAAQAEGKAGLSLSAIRELRAVVELLARLSGELDERPTVQVLNVAMSPEWAQIRNAMLMALAPYPQAHQAIAGALTELEA